MTSQCGFCFLPTPGMISTVLLKNLWRRSTWWWSLGPSVRDGWAVAATPFWLIVNTFFFFKIQYTYTQYTQYIGDYHNPWILNDGWFSDASSRGLAMIRGYSRVIVSGDTVETFAPAEPWRSELNIFLERPWKGISNDTREHVNVRSSCFSFY